MPCGCRSGLGAKDVAAFLTGCTGIRARRWQRPFVVRAIALEVTATSDGIIHHLFIPAAYTEVVLAALRAAMPGVVASRDETVQPPARNGSRRGRPVRLAQAARNRPGGAHFDGHAGQLAAAGRR